MKIILKIYNEDLNDFATSRVTQCIRDAKETGQCLTVYTVNNREIQSFTEKKNYGWKIDFSYSPSNL